MESTKRTHDEAQRSLNQQLDTHCKITLSSIDCLCYTIWVDNAVVYHCGDDLGLDEILETLGACRGDGWPRKKPSTL